jgi:hypothetical protein
MKKRDRIEQFSDNWLEVRYAWTPLLGDIYDAADVAAMGLNRNEHLNGMRTTSKHTGTWDKNELYWTTASAKNQFASEQAGGSYEQYETLEIAWSVTDKDYRADEALGLNNPALLAWELLPFSFVADWFLPIGRNLQQLTAFGGLKFHGGYHSKVRKCQTFARLGNSPYGGLVDWDFSLRVDMFHRTILDSFEDLPFIPWTQTKGGISLMHAMDSVTLLQRLLRKSHIKVLHTID